MVPDPGSGLVDLIGGLPCDKYEYDVNAKFPSRDQPCPPKCKNPPDCDCSSSSGSSSSSGDKYICVRDKEPSSSSCKPYMGCKKIRLEFDWSRSGNENMDFQVEMNTKDGLISSGSKCSANNSYMKWYDPTKKTPKVGVVDIDLEKAWCEEKMFDENYFFIRADWDVCKKGCHEGTACIKIICDGTSDGEYQITPGTKKDCPLTLVGELGYNAQSDELEFLVEGKEGEKCCETPCSKVCVTLTSDGCCLYMGPGFVEAVGKGTVTAEAELPKNDKCDMMILMNGEERTSLDVEDGDRIEVEIYASGDCECCEVGMKCLSSSSTSEGCISPSINSNSNTNFWVNKDNQLTEFTKNEIVKRIKFVTQKVLDRKRRLR